VEWAESNFWAESASGEDMDESKNDLTNLVSFIPSSKIKLARHQKATLRYIFNSGHHFSTVVWSTVKKAGKALSIDTELPASDGWIKMGNIRVGDRLFDENGQPCTVTYITEIMDGHKCYRVNFSDKNFIDADADHIWSTEKLDIHGNKYNSIDITTQQLKDSCLFRKDGARLYRIPITKGLQLPDKELTIAPYVLGAWLGDGESAGARITCCDQEILDRIAETEPVVELIHTNRAPTYSIGVAKRTKVKGWQANSLNSRLRVLGVLGNKHIPNIYLRASYEQRLALLQGLMDTDGYISEADGTSGCACEISTKFETLADNILELVRTLGIKPSYKRNISKLYGKDCGYRYRIAFYSPEDVPVFSLERKKERQRPRTNRTLRSENRHIIGIKPIVSVPVRCIQVDSPSHLYLAGKAMIPTHNTTVSALVCRYVAENLGPYSEIYCVANDYDQAKSRAYDKTSKSLSLDPAFNSRRRELQDRWKVYEKQLIHIPTGSTVKALATDYAGEAGSNPTLTVWTELWGYVSEASKRFWTELTPVPTRPFSMRWVETYAGYSEESELLENLYKLGKSGRQLTAGELGDLGCFEEATNPEDLIPIWVNEDAGLLMYWDEGLQGRRMDWQKGEVGRRYYTEQEKLLIPSEFNRLHLNQWSSGESSFVPMEWWDSCKDPYPLIPGDKTPLVLAMDASVTGDCTCLVAVSRHPDGLPKSKNYDKSLRDHVCERASWVWYPKDQPGDKMDYSNTLIEVLDYLIANYNVVEVAYDLYQLHHLVTEQRKKPRAAWYRDFDQNNDRLLADKGLFDMIRDRSLHHTGSPDTRVHIQGCNAKVPVTEENKLRLIKRSNTAKIDLAVAMSMAARECRRLNL
jgi:hypothetical protein